jgi:hypothetical protein
MKMNGKLIKKTRIHEETDDGFVQADKSELISMMWEITKDNRAFVRGRDAERRLQRDVAILVGSAR